jgi:hypothetical protein
MWHVIIVSEEKGSHGPHDLQQPKGWSAIPLSQIKQPKS